MKIGRRSALIGGSLGLYIAALPSTAVAADVLKIGIIAPLTGPAAPWGIAMAEGAKILAAHYNAEGGLDVGGKRYQLAIIAYDDLYSAQGAVTAYNRLAYEDKVAYVVVAAGISTMALKRMANDDKVVIMTSGFIADELDPESRYMYRMWGPPADFFPPLIAWLRQNRPERHVVIINPNDETARQNGELAVKLYKNNGYDVLSNELYERTTRDFLPLITKVLGLKPDVIDLGATAPATAALLTRQLREFNYGGLIFISGSTAWREVLAGAGPAASEGVVNVLAADPANKAYAAFAAEFRSAIGQEPNEVLAPYSDGVNFLIKSIQASGAVGDTSKFEEGFFKAAPFTTIQGESAPIGGKAEYGIDHQVNAVRYIGVIKSGAVVVVGKI